MKKPELLAPAGSLSKLKYAIMYGADAVYIGGEAFSLRVAAKNFTMEEIKEGINVLTDLFTRRLMEDRQKNDLIENLKKQAEFAYIEPFITDIFLEPT